MTPFRHSGWRQSRRDTFCAVGPVLKQIEETAEQVSKATEEVFEGAADQTEGRADSIDDLLRRIAAILEDSDDLFGGQPQGIFQGRGHLGGADSKSLKDRGDLGSG